MTTPQDTVDAISNAARFLAKLDDIPFDKALGYVARDAASAVGSGMQVSEIYDRLEEVYSYAFEAKKSKDEQDYLEDMQYARKKADEISREMALHEKYSAIAKSLASGALEDLSMVSASALARAGYTSVDEILEASEEDLFAIRGVGMQTINVIRRAKNLKPLSLYEKACLSDQKYKGGE